MNVSSFLYINNIMKINELINEALPYGFGNYIKNTLRSKVPFGISGQARARGEINRGQLSNRLYRGYFKWAGESQSPETADTLKQYLDLIDFPSGEAINLVPAPKGLGTNAPIDDNIVSTVIAASVKEKYGARPPVQQQPDQPTTAQASSNSSPTTSTQSNAINPDGSITIAGAKGAQPSKIMPTDPMYKSLRAAIEKQNQTPAAPATPTASATPAAKPRYKLSPSGQRIRIN